MKKNHLEISLAILAVILLSSIGCKSRTVDEPPPVIETPEVYEEPVEPDTVVIVEEEPDFVPEQEVEVEQLDRLSLAELNSRAAERGWIRDAYFAFDAYTLTTESQDNLALSAAWLKSHPEYRLRIEGHADERGTQQYNLALGERRAQSAKEYLMALGIPASRMRTISYGEERPFDTGSNESAWARNRRAHLVLER
ncbi:MAG: peptidoglycan-associated lipoprotein Pal [Acidobacteria bacterium]|nr:peptidoglycan-associated lipoprotein Pal [Acidobacteriota bacterium]